MKGLNICISPYRQYGEKRSAGFELKNKETEELIFTMDVDVNRHYPEGKIYEVSGFSFRGAAVNQMIADKLFCVSTDKVFRRIKDVVDLYYISEVIKLDKESVERILNENSLSVGDFDGFLNRKIDLKHSYDKFLFAGDVDKPLFDEVYKKVKEYILDFLKK